MIFDISVGLVIVLVTIFIHTLATAFAFLVVHKKHHTNTALRRVLHIDLIILTIIAATLIEALVWAYVYLMLGSFKTLEESLYFSLVTFTTLGYGDITLEGGYRLLGAIEATNGVIMLGWSTALVVSFIQRVYFNK